MTLPWVAEAFTLMLTKHRDIVGAVIVLTEDGVQSLKTKGRKPLIKQLRDALYQYFDAVVLPRKWLFLERMLMSSEGKIDQPVLDIYWVWIAENSPTYWGLIRRR